MDSTYEVFADVFGDGSVMMLALLVFLAVAVLSFGVMATVRSRGLVKRRAAGIAEYSGELQGHEKGSLRQSSLRAVQRLLDYTSKHYAANDKGDAKVLSRRLVQAGIFERRSGAVFFFRRVLPVWGFLIL